MKPLDLDSLVESHLNLQVEISYLDHHDFLLRYGLNECARVLDVGCGNGTFASRLSQDHPLIHFVGIDKRKNCVKSCQKVLRENLSFQHVDMFSRDSSFDFSLFDGVLMRYFLLHVDHSQKILELFKLKSKRPSRFWIIDLDWSQFACAPQSETFFKMTKLVQDFCAKISKDSMGGFKVLSLLEKLDYQNIQVENIPFTRKTISLEHFSLYLKQEVLCFSRMIGRPLHDPETAEIIRFIDRDVKMGKYDISYGMILVSAELAPKSA
jgi:ubiquinone/menaquinone biosynthesis C-methylase UbiE